MSNRHLVESFSRYAACTLLCVGDVMLDNFVYGGVTRISPEAPIPVLSINETRSMLGGAGNVARNLASLGARVIFITVTGDDAEADTVTRLLSELPNCEAHVIRDKSRPTTVKTRYTCHGQQLLRVDRETAASLNSGVFDTVIARFRDCLGEANLAILSDYAKGMLAGDHAHRLIEAATGAAKPVHVDPKGRNFARYRGASLIKPNLTELAEATGESVTADRDVERAARGLIRDMEIPAVLVTRGAAGMMLVRDGRAAASFQSRAREVYDVSGAGDTVAAVLAVSAATGLDPEDSVKLACAAAGLVVGKAGTATVTTDELRNELLLMP